MKTYTTHTELSAALAEALGECVHTQGDDRSEHVYGPVMYRWKCGKCNSMYESDMPSKPYASDPALALAELEAWCKDNLAYHAEIWCDETGYSVDIERQVTDSCGCCCSDEILARADHKSLAVAIVSALLKAHGVEHELGGELV